MRDLAKAARWLLGELDGDGSYGPDAIKALRTALSAHDAGQAGGGLDAGLLPMAEGLLRDAEDAIAYHRGPGQHVGTPKVTVDAVRLWNVARAVAAALREGAARAQQPSP